MNLSRRTVLLPLLFALPLGSARSQSYTYQLNDGFEGGVLSPSWTIDFAAGDASHVTVQAAPTPVRAGGYAVHLVNSYADAGDSNQRTEMTAGAGGTLQWDKEYWIGYSFLLKNWAYSTNAEAVHQIHSVPHNRDFSVLSGRNLTTIGIDKGVMSFEAITNPNNGPAAGGASSPAVWQAPVQSDAWYDWVMHVKPSATSAGFIEVWSGGRMIYQQNGQNVDTEDASGAASDPTHYLKVGVYNWPWETPGTYDVTSREIVYDQVRIGCVDGGYAGGYSGVNPQDRISDLSDPRSAPSTLKALWYSSTQVQLSWFDNSGGGTSFLIERKAGEGGAWSQVHATAAGAVSWIDAGLAGNTTYLYRIRASNGSSASPYSLVAAARSEDFTSGGAGDFTVPLGVATAVGSACQVAASSSADLVPAGLALLDTAVSGNFVLSATCTAIESGGASDNFLLVFGYQDASDFYYVQGSEAASASGLYRVSAGVTTCLAAFDPFPAGVWPAMKVQRVGQSLLVYRDGARIAALRDTTFMAGKVGLGTAHAGARRAQFLHVSLIQGDVDAEEQDFQGGSGDLTVAQGTWTLNAGGYEVTGNGTVTQAAALALLPEQDGDDFTILADGTILDTTETADNLSVVFHYQDINDYYVLNLAETGNAHWNGLFVVQAGVATRLKTWSQTFPAGAVHALRIQKQDGVIRAYVDGQLLCAATATTFSGGQVGFGVIQTGTTVKRARFDNISLVPNP